ncbi:hypothetical protein CC78DRAFT_585331 [Lojkania enalia]|uniref:Uncharacterized protein n=1 Tax=Lojkania enalia TaxID=147567 RepID=A0A9P4K4E5_9PLEO|nr:hypothetical protein CC78DRAFT_585331 [Didymosphaeria enalia]
MTSNEPEQIEAEGGASIIRVPNVSSEIYIDWVIGTYVLWAKQKEKRRIMNDEEDRAWREHAWAETNNDVKKDLGDAGNGDNPRNQSDSDDRNTRGNMMLSGATIWDAVEQVMKGGSGFLDIRLNGKWNRIPYFECRPLPYRTKPKRIFNFITANHSCELCKQLPVIDSRALFRGQRRKLCNNFSELYKRAELCDFYKLILSSVGPHYSAEVNEINIFATALSLSVEGETANYSISEIPRVFVEVESSVTQQKEIPIIPEKGARPMHHCVGGGFKYAMVIINMPILMLAASQPE